jgi:hypothetical protein
MKLWLAVFACLAAFCTTALADQPDISIPAHEIALIKTTDYVEVSGTNDLGGAEDFTIHNIKAIREFIELLTSDRFNAVPKSLKPTFKSMSSYKVRLSSKGALVLQLQLIADSILDLPGEPAYYMETDHYSANLMAPLLRLR